MLRKQPISTLLYDHLFPNPRPEDPTSFSAHLAKNLVPEVRIETATFYGSLDTVEARYPGLNYSHPPHRKRLGRFQHHARLFRAFDALDLTESEIAGFCRWEGTLWARQRYEKDEGVVVEDTTGKTIPHWVDPRRSRKHQSHKNRTHHQQPRLSQHQPQPQPQLDAFTGVEVRIALSRAAALADPEIKDGDDDVDVRRSVGFELNQRLFAAAAAREQGAGVPMDSEYEQWLKDIAERGALNNPSGSFAQQLHLPRHASAPQYLQHVTGRSARPSSSGAAYRRQLR